MNRKNSTCAAFKHRFGFMLALVVLCRADVCWSETYYVDYTGGNDSYSGTSPTSAWKTVANVNASSFSPGDSVLFKRGEAWNETLDVPSAGALNNPIIFGAYGSGDPPVLKRLNGTHRYNIVYENLHIDMQNESGIAFSLYNVQNITVQYCEVERAGRINLFAGPSRNLTIRHCEMHHAGTEHGIYISGEDNWNHSYSGSDSLVIEYCDIYSNGAFGIQFNANGTSVSNHISNYIVRHNRIHHNGYGALNEIGGKDGLFYNNLLYEDVKCGIDIGQSSDPSERRAAVDLVFCNNVIYKTGSYDWDDAVAIGGQNAPNTGIEFINNLIIAPTAEIIVQSSALTVIFDYNMYDIAWWGWKGSSCDAFTNWQSGSGQDTHSLEDTPAFADAAHADFHLTGGSPAIDRAQCLSNRFDTAMDGGVRPLDGDNNGSAAWDMGPYEYVNAAADTDGDGMKDADELIAGTDPRNPGSVLEIGCSLSGEETINVWFQSVTGRLYGVMCKDDLQSANDWRALTNNWPGQGGLMQWGDTNMATHRFYRVKVTMP